MGYDIQYVRSSVVNAEAAEMSEQYKSTLFPAIVEPLSPASKISVDYQHYRFDDWSVWVKYCRSGMSVSLQDTRPDAFILYLPSQGEMLFNINGHELNSRYDSPFLADMVVLKRLILGQDRKHLGILFYKAKLTKVLYALTGEPMQRAIEFCPQFQFMKAQQRLLYQFAGCIWDSLSFLDEEEAYPRFLSSLMDSFMILTLEVIPNNYSSKLHSTLSPALPRQVKKAIEFMHAHVGEQISIVEIAEASGVSVRSLQIAFQQFKDTTPLAYLRLIRLEGVRRAIQKSNGGESISKIAQEWGFLHMGRFSNAYFQAFGEIPSKTRAAMVLSR